MMDRFKGSPHPHKVKAAKHHPSSKSTTSMAAPAAVGGIFRTPTHNKMSRQSIKIERSEIFDATVVATSAFTALSYDINPGNSLVFPWLSAIARRFEEFEFTRLEFTYVGSCASTQTGRAVLAWDPDPEDEAPTSMIAAQQISGAVGFPFWTGQVSLPLDRKMLSSKFTNAKFVQTTDTAAVDYNHTLGRLHLLTEAGDDAASTGYVEVSYSINLLVPQQHETETGYLHAYVTHTPPPAVTNLLDSLTYYSDSNLDSKGWTISGNTIVVPVDQTGSYSVVVQINGDLNVTAPATGVVDPGTNGSLITDFKGSTGGSVSTVHSDSSMPPSKAYLFLFNIYITGATTIDLVGIMPTAVSGTTLSLDIFIHELPESHVLASQEAAFASSSLRIERALAQIDKASDAKSKYTSLKDVEDVVVPHGFTLVRTPCHTDGKQ